MSRIVLRSVTSLALIAAGCTVAVEVPVKPWRIVPGASMPPAPSERPLKAAFLILDGVFNTELAAPYDVFQHTVFHTNGTPAIEVFTVSPSGAPVTTFEGLRIKPHYGFADAPEPDILVVPSAEGNLDRDLEDEALLEWIRRRGSTARLVLSLCDGAFLLAAAGLLDGREATTFPGDQDEFDAMFPNVRLVREASFVHDGRFVTSQGGVLSYEAAMYAVDRIFGVNVAVGVGGGLLIPWPPASVRRLEALPVRD